MVLLLPLFRLLEDDDDGCPNSLLNMMIGTRARDNFFFVRKMQSKTGCLLKNARDAGFEKQTDARRKRAVRACFYGALILRDTSTLFQIRSSSSSSSSSC
jgi:hypothetical protein